ncbi:hypothetical protein ACWEWX_11255 [Streptomyces asiaticus]
MTHPDNPPTAHPPLPALLARLEADRARSAQNAADTRREQVARVFEGEEGAFRTAVEYTIHAFYGLEAAVAYHRNGTLPQGDPAVTVSTDEQDPSSHVYLSTSCLHAREPGREDLHAYCQGKTGMVGPKTPAVCKFCKSPCICSCHRKTSDESGN